MRAIVKSPDVEPHLAQAHEKPPANPAAAKIRWGRFGHKATVLEALLNEQYYLCCYSELRADEEGLGYHIEHVEPKSVNPHRTFDYMNLAASALHSETDLPKFAKHEVFGGHAKQNQFDANRFISCHTPDCARYFAYLSDGRIVARQNLSSFEIGQADYTIGILNLNSPSLLTLRKQWWKELEGYFEQHAQDGWSLSHLAAVDLVPVDGRLSRFFSITRQFFGPIAERTLQDHAPQLV